MLAGAAAAQPTAVVRYGVYANEPKVFLDDAGQPAGIFPELLAAVAEREGWRLQPVPCEWQACLDGLAEGRIDLMPDVAYSPERAARFDFHQTPVLHSWSQVYVRRQAGAVDDIQSLRGLRIAVLSGSVQERALRQLLDGFGVAVQWVPVASFDEGLRAVASAQADAVAVNHLYGSRHANAAGLLATAVQFNPSALYFATGPGRHPDWLATLDRYLQAWKADPRSVYFQALERWGAPVATAAATATTAKPTAH